MAEAAGLAIGAVSMLTVFENIFNLFGILADSRKFGHDYKVLETKFDFEKTLLQWIDRVGLLGPDYDRRLDDPRTKSLIEETLAGIKLLLDDTSELRERYGLVEVTKSTTDGTVARNRPPAPKASDHRFEDFIEKFARLKVQILDYNKRTPFSKKVRWVIRDKPKFKELLQELDDFITKLNCIIPARDDRSYRQVMADEDLKTIQDVNQLKIILEASLGSQVPFAQSAEKALRRACEDRILNKLWFRKMEDRKQSIEIEHERTLRWVLEPPEDDVPWDDFAKWLQFQCGIYWISGKAGSGKSTLMKYLFSNNRTRELLSQWAGEAQCYLSDFFFLNLGTAEQRSQEGLSRALLFQILSHHRSLIPEALPSMWKELRDSPPNSEQIDLPSPAETKFAFNVITNSLNDLGRYCFFIDGLDEFAGDYTQAIEFVTVLAANPNIKIVLSSRPIPECVEALDSMPKLQLHDLNRSDISLYVQDAIGSEKYMQRLLRRHEHQARQIICDIANKAFGIFLWVVLACRSLRNGFTHHESLEELRRRVDELPPELESMFKHMLGNINQRHREQGFRLLRICYAYEQYNDQNKPFFNGQGPMQTLGLALVDDYHIHPRRVQPLIREQKREACEDLECVLRSRCGGLLEIYPGYFPRTQCIYGKWDLNHDSLIYSNVRFMHRTVFEFLDTTWHLECLSTRNIGFSATEALSLFYLHLAMQYVSSGRRHTEADRCLEYGIFWGRRADAHISNASIFFGNLQPILDGVSVMEPLGKNPHDRYPYLSRLWDLSQEHTKPFGQETGLILAIESGAINHVRAHSHLIALVNHKGFPCGCLPLFFSAFSRSMPSADMIDLLLSSGCNPNESVLGLYLTPWTLWLGRARHSVSAKADGMLEILRSMELFVLAGADLQVPGLRLERWLAGVTHNDDFSELVKERARVLAPEVKGRMSRAMRHRAERKKHGWTEHGLSRKRTRRWKWR